LLQYPLETFWYLEYFEPSRGAIQIDLSGKPCLPYRKQTRNNNESKLIIMSSASFHAARAITLHPEQDNQLVNCQTILVTPTNP